MDAETAKSKAKFNSGTLGLNKFSARDFDNNFILESQLAASKLYRRFKDDSVNGDQLDRGVKRKRNLGIEDFLQDKKLKETHYRKVIVPRRHQLKPKASVSKREPIASTSRQEPVSSKQEPIASRSYGGAGPAFERMEVDDYNLALFLNARGMKSMHEIMEIGEKKATNSYNDVPRNVPRLIKERKRRLPATFSLRGFEPLVKRIKLFGCEGPCPCNSRGTLLSIAPIQRHCHVVQPLYKKLLKYRLLRPVSLSSFLCCERYCCTKWWLNRIPPWAVLEEYEPSDLRVTNYKWGPWKA